MDEVYELIKVERTRPSACESVVRVLIDEKSLQIDGSLSDFSRKICDALGFK